MKLVIENVMIGKSTAKQEVGGAIEKTCEVLYMGGGAFVKNPKDVPSGTYSSVSIEVSLKSEAKSWAAKDGRKGALIGKEIVFGDIVEATPVKK